MITKPHTAEEWAALNERMERVFAEIKALVDDDAPLEQQLVAWREAAEIAEAADSPSAVGIRRNIHTCEVLARMRAREEAQRKRRRWWRR